MSAIGQGFAETFSPVVSALQGWAQLNEQKRQFDTGLPMRQQELSQQAENIAQGAQRLGENKREFDIQTEIENRKLQMAKDAADPELFSKKLISLIDYLKAHYMTQGVSESEAQLRATAEAARIAKLEAAPDVNPAAIYDNLPMALQGLNVSQGSNPLAGLMASVGPRPQYGPPFTRSAPPGTVDPSTLSLIAGGTGIGLAGVGALAQALGATASGIPGGIGPMLPGVSSTLFGAGGALARGALPSAAVGALLPYLFQPPAWLPGMPDPGSPDALRYAAINARYQDINRYK